MAQRKSNVQVTETEARAGKTTGMIWVLGISLTLAVVAGVALGLGWITLP